MYNIGYIIDTIESDQAGTERQVLMLLKNLDRERFSPHIICLYASPWMEELISRGELIVLESKMGFGFQALVRIYGLTKIIKELRLDIVQTFFVDANVIGTIAAKLAGCKVIISSRRNTGHWLSRFHRVVLKLLSHWTTMYLANSNSALQSAVEDEGVDSSRIRIIPNGFDREVNYAEKDNLRKSLRRELDIPHEALVIGVVANLRAVKGLSIIPRVAKRLCEDYPALNFVIIGEGPERPELERSIRQLDLNSSVRLIGRREDVFSYISAFDAGVLCSHSESLSNTLVEYMMAGLPIVASNIPGNAEVIEHGQTGLLYEVKDGSDFEEKLRMALDDMLWAKALGLRAQKYAVKHFSLEKVVESHQAFYSAVLENTALGKTVIGNTVVESNGKR